jgi:lipopolysaccharide transport system permease protein
MVNQAEVAQALPSSPLIRIDPQRQWALPNVREVWLRRELIFFLFWRDLRVRYRQAALGAAWAILSPLLLMGVFTLFFGVIFATPSAGVPRPVFIFSGVLTWLFFAEAFNSASASLQKDKHLLAKLYFPRLIIPLASVLPSLVDYVLGLLALGVMMLAYHIPFRPTVLLLPLMAALVLYVALCVGIWFSALNLQYTDFRHLTPLIIQVWFYSTPIFYPASLIPVRWQSVYRLNPMVGVVEAVRWALFGTPMPEPGSFLLAFVPVTLILIAGAFYFTRIEPKLAELG